MSKVAGGATRRAARGSASRDHAAQPIPTRFGWGGAGGSNLWFNPTENIGFGYTCTGFAMGINGDAVRVEPIKEALLASPAYTYDGPSLLGEDTAATGAKL